MKKDNEKIFVYCGQIYTNKMPWRFQVDEIPVVDAGILGLKADAPYFQSRHCSSEYFGNEIFDEPLKITDEMTLFYSRDEAKCTKFLEDKYKSMLKESKLAVYNLENAVFVGKRDEERNNIALQIAEEVEQEIAEMQEEYEVER